MLRKARAVLFVERQATGELLVPNTSLLEKKYIEQTKSGKKSLLNLLMRLE
jgi:hypothetical protein